ncbi:MAG: beta-lactamase family protein, partial [Clostridiales bacterium]|nr:beta-lactamase family protein [Clostridiales bacterium]
MKLSRQIQEIMQQAIDTSEVAGISCLVMQHGKEQLYVHAGYADCAAEKEVKRDSIFRLYSQTKPV